MDQEPPVEFGEALLWYLAHPEAVISLFDDRSPANKTHWNRGNVELAFGDLRSKLRVGILGEFGKSHLIVRDSEGRFEASLLDPRAVIVRPKERLGSLPDAFLQTQSGLTEFAKLVPSATWSAGDWRTVRIISVPPNLPAEAATRLLALNAIRQYRWSYDGALTALKTEPGKMLPGSGKLLPGTTPGRSSPLPPPPPPPPSSP